MTSLPGVRLRPHVGVGLIRQDDVKQVASRDDLRDGVGIVGSGVDPELAQPRGRLHSSIPFRSDVPNIFVSDDFR